MVHWSIYRPRREVEWRMKNREAAGPRSHSPVSVMANHGRALPSTASEIVRVLPGMSPDTVVLTTYRHDGRPFLRIELPKDLAPSWVGRLERYTRRHDETQPAALRIVR